MTATAKEYRETLAMERAPQENPEKGVEILEQQMAEIPPPSINFENEETAGMLV